MNARSVIGSSALLLLLCCFDAREAQAQLLNGDDLVLTDPTPTVIFEDTDVGGSDWGVRGWQESFRIEEDVNKYAYLQFDNVLFSTALGFRSAAAATASNALGAFSASTGYGSNALGVSSTASGEYSSALGPFSSAPGPYGSAVGTSASATGTSGTAIGHIANAVGGFSAAVGYRATTHGDTSTALGFRAFATQANTMVLGSIPGVNLAVAYPNIGIGTNMPVEAVDVERSAAAARFQVTSFTSTAGEAPQFIQRRARGTTAAPTAVQSNDNLGLFSFRGYNGTSMGGSRATITAQAAGNFSASSTPTRLIFSTTPVGSTAPQSVLVITPDGKVQVKGVNLNVPDYVFEDDYELMPLDELKIFIDRNGHLPGIAPAHEVKSEGLDLAGSQMSQLQKIEELTLYTLQQQDLLVAQQEHLEAQESRLEAQQERIDNLETLLTRALARID